MENIEIWKPIKDYEGIYEVSNLGNVRSFKNGKWGLTGKYKILKSAKSKKGYLTVSLCKNRKPKTFTIHQLVAMSFLEHIPYGYSFICDHKNNLKEDNRLENLQIITQRENTSKDRKRCTSKFTGVYWNKKIKKWQSSIVIKGKQIMLGSFETETEASEYYINALNSFKNGEIIKVKEIKKTSKYKGVCWKKNTGKWISQIQINGQKKHLGCFDNEEDAGKSYQEALINLIN